MSRELLNRYNRLTVVEKIITINVVVFIVLAITVFLFQIPEVQIHTWLAISDQLSVVVYKPWTLITYAFLHGGLFRLLFNMFLLHFSGQMFTTYFTGKQFLNVYFLGAMAGALMYLLSYSIFPVFSNTQGVMIGASAAVMAVLVCIATHIPYMGVRLLLLGTVKLWHIAVFFVVLDLILLPHSNSGGRLAHLGGAILGYIYAKQLAQGRDIGKWWERLMDAMTGLFSTKKQKPLRTVYKKKSPRASTQSSISKSEKQEKIDRILDKISKSGYESLSKEEKEFLFKAGKDE